MMEEIDLETIEMMADEAARVILEKKRIILRLKFWLLIFQLLAGAFALISAAAITLLCA